MAKVVPTPEREDLIDIDSEWETVKKYVHSTDHGINEVELTVKIPIMTRSRVNKGDSFPLRVSIPREHIGFAAKLQTMYPETSNPSEMYRAAFYAGCKVLYEMRKSMATKEVDKFHVVCEEMERELYDLQILDRGWELIKNLKKELKRNIITQRQWKERRDKLVMGLQEGTMTALGKDRVLAIIEEMEEDTPGGAGR
jgi:hypothetical protein